MNLDFNKSAEVKQQNSNSVSKLKPGTHDNVFITGLIAVEPAPGKSPYLEATFVAEDGSGQHKEKFYMSEAAAPYSLAKIKELIVATGAQTPTVTDVNTVSSILEGKKIALRLYGEEVRLPDNRVVIVSNIAPTPFCAPAGKVDTLTFDSNYGVKKLATPVVPEKAKDDLPF